MRERCVLDRLQYIFETVTAGTHGERMSVIGDGHMLVGVLANLEGPGPRSGGAATTRRLRVLGAASRTPTPGPTGTSSWRRRPGTDPTC